MKSVHRLLRRLVQRPSTALGGGFRRGRAVRVECLERRELLAGDLAISEFMAANGGTLSDEDGNSSDWIEIHNPATSAVSLESWYLTDDANDVQKWQFPAVTIPPDGYLVVFASGNDRRDAEGELHTNFKLSAGGEYVALVSPAGTVVAEFGPDGTNYPEQQTDISYGLTPTGPTYFGDPTPGAPNSDGWLGWVEAIHVSVDRGFFAEPFELEIASPTSGATVRYTTDGSRPSATHGTVYTDPLTVGHTTTLRAAAFKPGFAPSPVATHTYLFLGDVLQQSETFGKDGGGLLPFQAWGQNGVNGDWEVDPEIVNHANPENRLTPADLRTVPTISVVLPWEDMFGEFDTVVDGEQVTMPGIYIEGSGVPRGASIEQILVDGSTGFQIDGAVEIQGGSSTRRWKADKLSMRVKFTSDYGPTMLDYPLFGEDATDRFDTFILDATLNDGWHVADTGVNPRNVATFIADQFVANLQDATGGTAPHARYHHVYINGLYWGMYYVHERPDASFAEAYLGGDEDDYDVLKHNPNDVVQGANDQGTNDNYNAMLALARQDLSDDANYQNLAAMLDIDDFISYMLVNFYTGNDDWAMHNWYATFNRVDPGGKWRYHSWDAEIIMKNIKSDVTDRDNAGGPTEIHQNLLQNTEYRLLFSDQIQAQFFHDGVLTPEGASAQYQKLMGEIDRAILGETARWGDNKRESTRTRLEWRRTLTDYLRGYFPYRTAIVLDQLRFWDLYPDVPVPTFNRHGGDVSTSFGIDLTVPAGTVYYTTDGHDPRLPGGSVAATAIRFDRPFQLTHGATVKARTLHEGQWSALEQAEFFVTSELPLRITEINYNPHDANQVPGLQEAIADNDRFEYVELTNIGSATIDLGGVQLTEIVVDGNEEGIAFTFAPQTLAPGEHVVVVRDRAVFQSRYGTEVGLASGSADGGTGGQFGGTLSNNGEHLALLDAVGAIIHQFAYGSTAPWPGTSAGGGSSLEVIDPAGDYNDAENWRGSLQYGGSPGFQGSEPNPDVVINEVLSRGAESDLDLIELYNTATREIDLSGWYLSDDMADLLKSSLPAATTIPPGGYLVLRPADFGFGLSGTEGDDVWLIEADGSGRPVRFADHARFDATDVGATLGRWPNGDPAGILFPMASPSFGAANVGAITGAAVISEVHYDPVSTPIAAADFSAGTAGNFTPVLGTWIVDEGGLEVTPGAEDDTIALMTPGALPPTEYAFSTTMRIRTVAGFKQNGVLIFDYFSPTDFKFISLHAGGNKLRIGERNATGWNFLTERDVSIPADTDIDLRFEVRGSWVMVWANGVYHSYNFATWLSNGELLEPVLGDGQVGVGSRGGTPRFEDVTWERLGDVRDLQFLELVGTTGAAVDLGGWRLTGAVELTFAPGTTVGVGEALAVVGFDPDDLARTAFFRDVFAIDDSVVLVGPFARSLSSAGDPLQLMRPVAAADESHGWVLVDQVTYSDQSPWPTAAGGEGRALGRAAAAAFGNAASSWSALVPTPGTVRYAQTGDLNFDGDVGIDDVHDFALLLANPSAYRAAYGVPTAMVGDADGDGDIDFNDIDDFVALLGSGMTNAMAAAAAGSDTGGFAPRSVPTQVANDTAAAAATDAARAKRADQRLAVDQNRKERRCLARPLPSDPLRTLHWELP